VLLASFSVIPFFQDGNTASMLALIFQNLKRLPAMLIAAYTFNDYLLPQYYAQKKYLVFGVLTILLFYVTSALDRVVNVYVYEPLFREPPFVQESIKQIFSDIPFLIGTYLSPVLIASITMTFERVIRQKQAAENRNIELERDKNRAELNALKSQLHPHFLFNTLNNLYALTVQKSDKAPETVATLSEMLDYILYQCNDRLVPLQKEVDLLENYITLERLRYGDDIAITTVYAFAKADSNVTQNFSKGTNEENVTQNLSKGTNEENVTQNLSKGTNEENVAQNLSKGTNEDNVTQNLSKGTNEENVTQNFSKGTNEENVTQNLSKGTNEENVTLSLSKGNAGGADLLIAPLLLLSIVENAFKHGASGSIATPEIHINIRQEGDQLFVEVKNTKSPSQQQDPTGYSKGIGVSNVQRQLALLYSDFSYEVTDENGWFAVALRLNTTAIND
jgi:hypothetical protein